MEHKRRSDARHYTEPMSKRNRTSSSKTDSQDRKPNKDRKKTSRTKSYSSRKKATHHHEQTLECSSAEYHIIDSIGDIEESPERQQPRHKNGETCEDISTKSILPTRDELEAGDNYHLKPNPIDLPYSSVDEYLSIQFNLLKEDYLRPLRRAISYARDVLSRDVRKDKRSSDVNIYSNVRVSQSLCSRERGILFEVQLRRNELDEKNLMPNALVLLTTDRFKTFAFGTVETHIKSTSGRTQGIGVKPVEPEAFEFFRQLLESGKPLDMIETTAFFYMTSQTLEGLQAMASEHLKGQAFPLCEHIVLGKSTYAVPGYVKHLNNAYKGLDISCIMENAKPHIAIWQNTSDELWPETSVLLNEMQYKAFRHAFSHPLALIQGPPGTGKSFMGLLIVRTILRTLRSVTKDIRINSIHRRIHSAVAVAWTPFSDASVLRNGDSVNCTVVPTFHNTANDAGMEDVALPSDSNLHYENAESLVQDFGPILVVCFKNHALDQFLLSIIRQDPDIVRVTKESPGIIRVGGGCKDKTLVPHLLPNCSSKYASEEDTMNLKVTRRNMLGTEEQIKKIETQITNLCNNIVSPKSLCVAIGEGHLHQLKSENTKHCDGLLKWLFRDFPDDQELERRQSVADETSYRSHNGMGPQTKTTTGIYDLAFSESLEIPALYLKLPSILPAHKVQHLLRDDEIEHLKQVAESGQRSHQQFAPSDLEKVCDKYPNIWDMPQCQRWDVYYAWTEKCKPLLKNQKKQLEETYISLAKELKLLLQEQDYHVLKKAKIIAMTTTAAGKYRPLLQRVAPRVVVIEEAAEVLESHIITALSEHTEHVIMIGDHQQLRPDSHDYELGKSHKLTCSMFERLVNVKVPFETLNVQHRMRPEISTLIVPEIYTSLVDHKTVEDRPNVRGMQKNIFFMNHTYHDTQSPDSTSRSNEFEAHMVCCLTVYLVMQGYQQSDITIIATYESQRQIINKRLRKLMSLFTNTSCSSYPIEEKDKHRSYTDADSDTAVSETVKVTTVDNYQGEENKIVLLSLVRSNTDLDSGYVKDKLRICVMLSRARDGLYVIGNLQQMKTGLSLWRKILNKAEASGLVGNYIPIQCPIKTHPDHKSCIFNWPDFSTKAPEGGCRQRCEVTKECGHLCNRLCHGVDTDHSLPCLLPCVRRCQSNHRCLLKCNEPCGPCKEIVTVKAPGCNHYRAIECHLSNTPPPCIARIFTTLGCGHTTTKQCVAVEVPLCPERCNKLRTCGHRCSRRCAECSGNCEELPCRDFSQVTLSCGHAVEKECSAAKQTCTAYCNAELQCGHRCKNICGFCFNGRIHGECRETCTKTLICGHEQSVSQCDQPWLPCELPCTRQCKHALCEQKCGKLCDVCSKKCKEKMTHTRSRCSKPCFEPCNKVKRGKKCHKKFPCGHKCQGVRGLRCPEKCRTCHSTSKEDDPTLELECGHRFDVSDLDKKLSARSARDQTAIYFLKCPECKIIITHPRYRNADVTKQARKDLEKVKRKLLLFDLQDVEKEKKRFFKLAESSPRVQKILAETTNIRKIIIATNVARLAMGLNKLVKAVTSVPTFSLEHNLEKLQTEAKRMVDLVETWQVTSSVQNDILLELRRLGVWYNVERLHREPLAEHQSRKLSGYLEKLRLCNRVILEDLEEMKQLCCDLAATSTSITVSWVHEVTLEEIPDSQHSSWLKCSKGHIYYAGVSSRIAGRTGCSKCDENL